MRYTDELADEIVARLGVPEDTRQIWKYWLWIPDHYATGARNRTPLSLPEDWVVWRRTTKAMRSEKVSVPVMLAAAEIPEARGLLMLAGKTIASVEEMAALQHQISKMRIAAQIASRTIWMPPCFLAEAEEARAFFRHPALRVSLLLGEKKRLLRNLNFWLKGGRNTPRLRRKLAIAINLFLDETDWPNEFR